MPSLDLLVPTAIGTVSGVPALCHMDDASALRLRATVLVASELAGIATATAAQSTQYGKDREQFGTPVGAFQAVQAPLRRHGGARRGRHEPGPLRGARGARRPARRCVPRVRSPRGRGAQRRRERPGQRAEPRRHRLHLGAHRAPLRDPRPGPRPHASARCATRSTDCSPSPALPDGDRPAGAVRVDHHGPHLHRVPPPRRDDGGHRAPRARRGPRLHRELRQRHRVRRRRPAGADRRRRHPRRGQGAPLDPRAGPTRRSTPRSTPTATSTTCSGCRCSRPRTRRSDRPWSPT